jgi:hypothetical protein
MYLIAYTIHHSSGEIRLERMHLERNSVAIIQNRFEQNPIRQTTHDHKNAIHLLVLK